MSEIKYININDDRFWQILFDEACVEGKQAERIQNELEQIAVDEKEIIRKPMQEIVERLEEKRTCSDYGTCNHCQMRWCPLELLDADEAIEIVKEVGGTDESNK